MKRNPIMKPVSQKQQQAQGLVYDAFETHDEAKRSDLMRKARVLDPDNVDALCYTAAHAPDIQSMLRYYKQAVRVGEEQLGEEFESFRPHFWGFSETRPFMRAKAGLIQALLFDGQTDEAISNMWEMLSLNKMDNQGIRYTLSTALLEADDWTAYKKLLALFPSDSLATWKYNKALFEFRQHPKSAKSVSAIKAAMTSNRFVAAYLLDAKPIPQKQANSIMLGQDSEAVEYAQNNKHLWENTPGALERLKILLK